MTTRTDVLETIANGENSRVEFKRDEVSMDNLAKDLVAFSNLAGGKVLLGVNDDGTISGLTRKDLEMWVINTCRDKIEPPIIPFFQIVKRIEDEKDVAIVQVPQGFDVCALWHKNTRKYLMRVGSRSKEASQEELARLFKRRGPIRTELQPVSGATLAHLDIRRLRNYFISIRQQEVPANKEQKMWQFLLENTDIMTEEGVTVGGMLLFGRAPNRFLPHAGITAVAYPGTEKDYATLERATLRGPVTPLLNEENDFVDNGLVEQALHFINRNTRHSAKLEGGRRIDCPTYPRDVLREGIVNALIHRDYVLTGTDIELSIFSDRLEIISPGRLPNGVTVTSMRTGKRTTRNQLLKDVMRDYRYLEHLGMGIPRKIIKGMREHNGTEPELIEQDERFTLRLYA